MTKLSSERGMSLVEATIILLVVATLTAAIAPSMGDYLEDARDVKAKEDVKTLGVAIVRMLRDTGLKGLKLDAGVGFTEVNRVDNLMSEQGTAAINASASYASADIQGGSVDWDDADNDDTFENQLVENRPGGVPAGAYSAPATTNRGRGWRGSYLNVPAGEDPWGYKYYANAVFLTVATDSTAGGAEGNASGFWAKDFVVLSAGPDNTIQSDIAGSGTSGFGMTTGNDDVVFVVQGNTR
jgi:type II secretory pathway pseudopilin PulG